MNMDFAAAGRPEVRITPVDVGKRISVRRLLKITEGRPEFTDTVGVLTSWNEGVLRVTRRAGTEVRIAESSLVAGRIVPPAPARRGSRRIGRDELQEIANRAWPAAETDRLGDWILRAAGGFTRRPNSVLPLGGGPGLPLDAALDRVVRWYGARGLPAYVQIVTGPDEAETGNESENELSARLADRGWTVEGQSLVKTAPLLPLTDTPGTAEVVLSRHTDAAWLSRYHRTGGLDPASLKIIEGGASVWFATVPAGPGEAPAAIGRCVADGTWAGFFAIEVAPDQRRRGLAGAVMAALARRAAEEGATQAYLQVEADNGGAGALYDGMGFTTHHRYHYRRAPRG